MKICVSSNDSVKWDGYVWKNRDATFYHLAAWRAVMEECFGHSTVYFLAHEHGEVRGLLPLVYMKSRLFPRCLVSLPYFCSGGVIADNKEIASALIAEARLLMMSSGAELLLIRQQNSTLAGLSCDTSKATFLIELDPDPDKVFHGFEKQVRRRIRKAYASGLQTEWGTGFLTDFYNVYATNMRDLGIPIHGYEFYDKVVSRFHEHTQIFVVRLGDNVVAAQLLFTFKDRLLLVCAGSLRDYLDLCPNNLLYWEAIKYGCLNGYRVCDFGRSPKGSGPYEFKAQWGGEERECPMYFIDASGRSLCRVQADNSRYHLVREVWKRLPVGVTTVVGPRLVRHLP